jgi:hypothetical protein
MRRHQVAGVLVLLGVIWGMAIGAQDDPLDVQAEIARVRESNSTVLNLIARGLDALPPEIFSLTQLEGLFIGNSSSVINLTTEGYVKGDDNTFSSLPPEITNLSALKILEIYNGNLDTILPEIGELMNLETLIATEGGISELPGEIGNLTQLKSLNLRGNLLEALPPEFSQLIHLETLDIGRNLFREVPSVLYELPALRLVHIDGNSISAEEFERLDKHLTGEDGTPITTILIIVGAAVVSVIALWRLMQMRKR